MEGIYIIQRILDNRYVGDSSFLSSDIHAVLELGVPEEFKYYLGVLVIYILHKLSGQELSFPTEIIVLSLEVTKGYLDFVCQDVLVKCVEDKYGYPEIV